MSKVKPQAKVSGVTRFTMDARDQRLHCNLSRGSVLSINGICQKICGRLEMLKVGVKTRTAGGAACRRYACAAAYS